MTVRLSLLLAGALFLGCSDDAAEPADQGQTADTGAEDASGVDSSPDRDTEQDAAPIGPYAGHTSETYSDLNHWLCHPDRDDDPCDESFDTTVVYADGSTEIVEHVVADDPLFDCFYVYPTISSDSGDNSDLEPGVEEGFVIQNQAGRLASECRLFGPVYRQGTLTALLFGGGADFELAYADVLDAWKHYIANESDGRPFLLIGHSQGTGMLRLLMQNEIDGVPELQDRLVAAYLIGSTIEVPDGEDVGGSFDTIPLCRQTDQTGCVVTFASFRDTDPPTNASRFGRAQTDGHVAACNNPASLTGGSHALIPYSPRDVPGALSLVISGDYSPFADSEGAPEITTPYFMLPDFIEGECVVKDGYSYLEITINADPDDPRADDITGDFTEGWGLHLVDVNLTMGDILALVQSQAAAYLAAN